jgi:hypothetical protein
MGESDAKVYTITFDNRGDATQAAEQSIADAFRAKTGVFPKPAKPTNSEKVQLPTPPWLRMSSPQAKPPKRKVWKRTPTEFACMVRDSWEASKKIKAKTLNAALTQACQIYERPDGRLFSVRSLSARLYHLREYRK